MRMSLATKSLRRMSVWMTLVALVAAFCHFAGAFDHLFELSYDEFRWPLDVDVRRQVGSIVAGRNPDFLPLRQPLFQWTLKNESRCDDTKELFLVILIKSAVKNRANRDTIRDNWGADRDVLCRSCSAASDARQLSVRRYFLLGTTNDRRLQEGMASEQQLHGDILQQNFVDFYYNNTHKTVMGLKFAATLCPKAKFFLFVDDDYHVDIANLLRLLWRLDNSEKKTVADDLYMGYRFFSHVMRQHWSPFRLSLADFPFATFPPYITAGAYVMSAASVRKFHLAAQFVRQFRFDDVYLGIIAWKLGVSPRHNDQFLFWERRYDPVAFEQVVAAHGFKDLRLMQRASVDSVKRLDQL